MRYGVYLQYVTYAVRDVSTVRDLCGTWCIYVTYAERDVSTVRDLCQYMVYLQYVTYAVHGVSTVRDPWVSKPLTYHAFGGICGWGRSCYLWNETVISFHVRAGSKRMWQDIRVFLTFTNMPVNIGQILHTSILKCFNIQGLGLGLGFL